MIGSRVLIVDDSSVFRQMLAVLLGPHCREIFLAGNAAEARGQLARLEHLDLLLSGVLLSDGDGFDLLDHAQQGSNAAPRVVLITGRPIEADRKRALALGALGYLSKPLSMHQISEILMQPRQERARSRVQGASLARAILNEPGFCDGALFSWRVDNLSPSGAFLETWGPVAVGTRLDLTLIIGGAAIDVTAKVVRQQEPSWSTPGGVGVFFTRMTPETRRTLEAFIATLSSGPAGGHTEH